MASSPDPSAIAALLSSGRPERLYSGLSVLVSAAAASTPARGLVSFSALALLAAPALERRAHEALAELGLPARGRARLARALDELWLAAAELDELELWACAASVEVLELDPRRLRAPLRGVRSTPAFLLEVADARLLFV